ncbi:CobW family GTP-binding protein [Staphylococcus ratti]|uniref:GTP-binding protein n=1 Tax=Staphylococcus ratti TaxID=2892440 RepID=A0ABY3PBW4_9STAP|nr:GTP-binding protein [Staphylococcus ratti]UEX89799.1 GTP-binding protein [Staphylococcus ratti]
MLKNKVKVTIVNGFLGSGKTTFLNKYMPQILKNDEKVALIVNEFGNFDMDGQLLTYLETKVSLMHGCVCCDLQSELVSTIQHLIATNQVEHIVIEATGIANPIDMLLACEDPSLVNLVYAPQVITIVAAPDILKKVSYRRDKQRLLEDQMRASHYVIINKIDLLEGEAQREEIEKTIQEYAPNSERVWTSFGETAQPFTYESEAISLDLEQSQGHPVFQSMTYTFQGPIAHEAFVAFILKFPETLLRVKGFIKFREQPGETMAFQYSHPVPSLESIGEVAVPLTLVFIGEQLDKPKLRNQLDVLQFS